MLKIGVLTSSRADYGIYLPLLKKFKEDNFFRLEIIAFGTHLSKFHGFTISEILKEDYVKVHPISSLITNDNENSISTAYGLTVLKFADFWQQHQFDIVFCLGDRFEMSAAVQAGIPYNITFAHIHGGETTLGAIDNIYRHQITLASKIHFTSTDQFKKRVAELVGEDENIFSVGSLSLNDINHFDFLPENEFRSKFNIQNEFILITFHPETVDAEKNLLFANQIKEGLQKLSKYFHLVITMPNADTMGTIFRDKIIELKNSCPEDVTLIENFGKKNYFSAMKYCKFLLGNTSSGIIEAASFNKFVINVGDRQLGRAISENTFHIPFIADEIYSKSIEVSKKGSYEGENIYFTENVADNIIKILKKI